MGILGMNISSMQVHRDKPITGKIEIRNTPKIEDIRATTVVGGIKGEEKVSALEVSFVYSSTYANEGEELAKIEIKGTILYTDKEEVLKDLEKEWKKSKKLKNRDVEIAIFNYIFAKITIIALKLADMMELPPVISMPRIVKEKDKE